jgi:hypothetical protein
VRTVRLVDAAKCRGIRWLWSSFLSAIVNQAPPVGSHDDRPCLFCLTISDERAVSRSDHPEPPVPRRSAS